MRPLTALSPAGLRRVGLALLVAAFALLAAGCGGDGVAPETATPVATPAGASPTASPTPAPAEGRILFIDGNGNLAVIGADGSDRRTLTEGGGSAGFQWSPDGSLVAVEDEGGAVRVMRADGGVVFRLDGASDPTWSPKGGRLAVGEGPDIAVYGADGRELRRVADAVNAAWSPDGEKLAFLRAQGGKTLPVLLDVASGETSSISKLIGWESLMYPIAWRPDGGAIAYEDGLYEPASGAKTALPGTAVSWSPEGRLLMVTLELDPSSGTTSVRLLDMGQGGKAIIGLDVWPAADGTPPWWYVQRWTDWSDDGRYLVYLDPDPTRGPRVRIYDTAAVTQAIFRGVRGELPRVSPDGKHAAFADAGKVWVLALDGSSLVDIAEGSHPAWQGGGP